MFPQWFQILFYLILYGVGIPLIIYGFITSWKDLKWSLENPVEYEEDEE